MKTTTKYSPEFRERAVRMVFEHQGEHKPQWAAIVSIASKIGCAGETWRKWVRHAERDQGKRSGLSSSDRDRLSERLQEDQIRAIPTRLACKGGMNGRVNEWNNIQTD